MMDLLDLAQQENSQFKLNIQMFSLLKTIENSFQVVSHIANLKGVALVKPQLESREKMLFTKIEGDPSRYQQVLVNLLSNALKFSSQG